ncbi:Scn10a [Symbiodinium sp. CCMP2592]|nr:Scn10a [Symbiodinium sp. CCMP2592]
MSSAMILSCVLAVIFVLQDASGYRHEMRLHMRNEASNKSAQHGGASGDDSQASLSCETGVGRFECEDSKYYWDSFKYMGDGKCCTQKSMVCEDHPWGPMGCEGIRKEWKQKGWKFLKGSRPRTRARGAASLRTQKYG